MELTYWVFPVAALIPLIIGSIWYNPKVFGTAWLKSSGLTEEEAASGNMAVIFGLTFVLSIFLAFALYSVVVHQSGLASLFFTQEGFGVDGSETMVLYSQILEAVGDKHRTFGHGAFHGSFAALMVALPIIGILALFERRGFKYIAVHTGYWIISLALMGGLLCQLA